MLACNHHDKNHSGLAYGLTLAAGLIAGVAAGLFLRSERAEGLADEASRLARLAKRRVTKGLSRAQRLSRATYEDVVEEILERYQDTRELAEGQVDQLRRSLLARWEEIGDRLDPDTDEKP